MAAARDELIATTARRVALEQLVAELGHELEGVKKDFAPLAEYLQLNPTRR